MTLDEAIKHAEEVAEKQEGYYPTPNGVVDEHKKCAEEHRQLAEWLKDYKRLLEQETPEEIEPPKHKTTPVTLQVERITKHQSDFSDLKPCEDAISREWVKKFLYSYYECVNENTVKENYKGDTLMDYEVAEMIEDCIANAPSVNPARPKGKWINTAPKGMSDNIVCNQCGYNSIADYRFCPNCGCQMEESERE